MSHYHFTFNVNRALKIIHTGETRRRGKKNMNKGIGEKGKENV